MTTPINLTQLREDVRTVPPEFYRGEDEMRFITTTTLLALIDTAEAAIHAVAEVETGPYYYKRVDELGETLNHYTTTP
jgi:hypothetical protein